MSVIHGSNYGTPSVDLDFAVKKNLTDRVSGNLVSFTRNSVGTYVDENGLIQSATSGEARFDHNPTTGESLGLLVEEARTNSQTYSTHLASSSWSTADATAVPNAALAPDGTFTALRLVENSANAVHNYAINYTEETTSSLTIFAKEGARRYLHIAVSGNIGIFTYSIIIDLRTAVINDPKFFNGTPISSSSATMCANGWVKISVSSNKSRYWKVSISTASVHTNFDTDYGQETYAGDGTSDLFLWGIQYEAGSFPTSYIPTPATFTGRASTATYYDASGVIQTAGVDVARDNAYFPDENGVMRPAGLLLEAAGTNLVTYSEQFDNAIWTKVNTSITTNAATAPDGTTTADTVVATSGFGYKDLYQNFISSVSPNTTYTFSVFVKANGARYFTVVPYFNGSSYPSWFDLSTGQALSNSTGNTSTITAYPNGWYKCIVTRTSPASGTALFIVRPVDANSEERYTGTGAACLYLWGAQLEAGSYPTSYIPTTGSTVTRAADTSTSSTVTRAADVVSLSNTNLFDPTEDFTYVNKPLGTSSGSNTISFNGPTIKRTTIYPLNLSRVKLDKATSRTDEFWRWRVLGSSFALPSFTTDGQVTVDWGDGTIETLTTAEHTFSNGSGYHDIGFRLDSGTYFRPRINGNGTHKDKLIAIGPAPESMKIRAQEAFNGCTNLQAFDPTIAANGETDYSYAWQSCSSLKNFPLIDTSGVTYMLRAWRFCSGLENFAKIDTSSVTSLYEAWDGCSSLTSFPVIDTSNVTDFSEAWDGCSSLTEFPVLDTSKGTSFSSTWQSCSSLTEFPSQIDVSKCSNFVITWRYCSGLTSFPALDFSSATSFGYTWMSCSSLTSFPTLSTTSLAEGFEGTWYGCGQLTTIPICDYSSATTFNGAWVNCSNLTTIPANLFDTTGTLAANAFSNAFVNDKLSAQSIENLLVSLVANGATGVTLSMNGGSNANTSTWSTAANNAYLELVNNRGWTITQNGTAPT